jgi:hypothetical protein
MRWPAKSLTKLSAAASASRGRTVAGSTIPPLLVSTSSGVASSTTISGGDDALRVVRRRGIPRFTIS